jgi:hypothetical protein
MALYGVERMILRTLRVLGHAGETFQAQVFLVSPAVGAAVDGADLVVEPLEETEEDLYSGLQYAAFLSK